MPQQQKIIVTTKLDTTEISCANCRACCCRLEVFLFTDTGVPERYISEDQWGTQSMQRDDDGWCVALDRNTLMCGIYESRPLVCREFEVASMECIEERERGL